MDEELKVPQLDPPTVKIEVEEPKHGTHFKLYTKCLRDSFDYLEGDTNYLMASQDSPANQRPDRNRRLDKQCDNDIESGVGTCGDGPCFKACTKPVDDSLGHFHEKTISPSPAISDSVICDLCFGEFHDELTLKQHITSVHSEASNIVILDPVSLKCTKCNVEANSREDLQNHAMLHDEDKKFAYDLCGCRFFIDSNLKTHLKSHTTNDIDTFKQNSDLEVHQTKIFKKHKRIIVIFVIIKQHKNIN